MDKRELQKQVKDIYLIISALTVSGDAVDLVAAARAKLRRLDEDIGRLPEAESEGIPTTAREEDASDGG